MSSLTIHLHGATDVPKKDLTGESDPYVDIDVIVDGEVVASASSEVIWNDPNPNWDSDHTLSGEVEWDVDATKIKFSVYDKNLIGKDSIGEVEIAASELLATPTVSLFLTKAGGSNPVLGSKSPHWPCTLSLSLSDRPSHWPAPAPPEQEEPESDMPHIVMITRGTRGDVQPFVALARGMAQQRGWLVTVITERRWKPFLLSNTADCAPGRVRFLDSGGDTETRVNSSMGQWATSQKTEFIQMMMLACSESEFFSSASIIMKHLQTMQASSRPASMVVYGFTLTSIALMAGEYYKIPAVGFFLQPSGIPSSDPKWSAVQAISSHGGLLSAVDNLEEKVFTSQDSLALLKRFAEKNPFATFNINSIRGWFELEPADTWSTMRERESPVVIPMRSDTFVRPEDWWDNIITTDFIFLREGAPGSGSLPEPLQSFVQASQDAGNKLGVMTFSSMPVPRKTMLKCVVKMLRESGFALRLIYVGKRHEDEVPQEIQDEVEALESEGRFLDVERADFGVLFQFMDLFIVHGGLGTTVEALRMKKPTVVTGPLLLDQRFWGSVCFEKGVGGPPVHIDNFEEECVGFVDGALDPADPEGWQARAAGQDWGDTAEDGVKGNVEAFAELLERGQ